MQRIIFKSKLAFIMFEVVTCLVPTLYAQQTLTDAFSASGGRSSSPNFEMEFILGQSSPTDIIQSSNFLEVGGFLAFSFSTTDTPALFRVERSTGDVFTDGAFMPIGADIAEYINVTEPVEPGDVVELDPDKPGYYRKARSNSLLIAGVITTNPGVTLGNKADGMKAEKSEGNKNRVMLTLMGRVPVKATTENGPINPGDLLTISTKPGYAMRCAESQACEGAIIGKALQSLETGKDLILVLVMGY